MALAFKTFDSATVYGDLVTWDSLYDECVDEW